MADLRREIEETKEKKLKSDNLLSQKEIELKETSERLMTEI